MFKNVYVCGDIHGELDFFKLTTKYFPEQKNMKKEEDLVIILGDFGFIWHGRPKDNFNINELLGKRNFTIAFVDGNHENFDELEKYPVVNWCGGKAHKINDNIYHLMRGEIFNFANHSFFCFGGAHSIDKIYRTPGKSWWAQEVPTLEEMNYGIENLYSHNDKVDFILTHEAPTRFLIRKYGNFNSDEINRYFDFIEENIHYNHWYFGHHHIDFEVNEKLTCLYQEVKKIV